MINKKLNPMLNVFFNKQCLLFMLVFFCRNIYCQIPAISDFSIIAGFKGVVLSVASDIPIDSHMVNTKGSIVSIWLKARLTSSGAIEYDKFASDAAVNRISISEIKNRKETEIKIYLNFTPDQEIKTQIKGEKWLALLSGKKFSDLKWSSSEYKKHKDSENNKTASCNLNAVKLLTRENVSELYFEFDKDVRSEMVRHGDTLLIKFSNAENKTGSVSFELPTESVYKSIVIKENRLNRENEFIASVVLNQCPAESEFNIISKKDRGLSLIVVHKNKQKALIWNSIDGLKVGYDFYRLPSYEIDMNVLEKRAVSDNSEMISGDYVFNVQETNRHFVDQDDNSTELELIKNDMEKTAQVNKDRESDVLKKSSVDLKMSLVKEIPLVEGSSRKLIRYNRYGRDPFLAYDGYMKSSSGLAFLENLNLVGILYDDQDRIALFEDKNDQNRPIALREEERIENGKVLKIYRDKVVFLITEYGISRSVVLRLTNISSNQEVGIR